MLPRSQEVEEDGNGDGDCDIALAQGAWEDCSVGEAGARSHPSHNGKQS